ncbi:MAG: (d)CMP kinase [Thermoprotei archaeon]
MVVIAISGPPGSGKTTQAKLIAKYFGLEYYSAGNIFREIARKRGLSLEELSRIALEDPSIDLEIDRRTYEIASTRDNIVLDGHLVAWIVSDIADYKVYLTAPLPIRVKRIAQRDGISLEKAMRETIIREYYEKMRFIKYYGINVDDLSIFDLVIRVDKLGIEEVFETIKVFLEKSLKSSRI